MPGKILLTFFLLLSLSRTCWAQVACTTLGQNPSSAFPICGITTFSQTIVPNCGGKAIPGPCTGALITDINPFWYKFTCYETGTLGLLIVPVDRTDDYDWQLFDITGHNPNDVYTDKSLFVCCNWSGNSGATGTSTGNFELVNCWGYAYPTFSSMPTVIQGHEYLLLVSHFNRYNPGDDGYGLSFGGGTAVITDTSNPAMKNAYTNCSGQTISLKLNKEMKCSSLAADASDFSISSPLVNIKSIIGVNCSSGFEMDSIIIKLDKSLPPGSYKLIIRNGKDNNTLLDNCDNPIPANDSIPFIVYPLAPTQMDSMSAVLCLPKTLQLVFENAMRCNSIAADGSDFVVNGSEAVSVIGARGVDCSKDGLTKIIEVQLKQPIQTARKFALSLKKGNDGNTLLNECAKETPASTLNFLTADTVNADFSYHVGLGCVYDTLQYAHDGRNNVNQWNWIFDANGTSTTQDSMFLFKDYGTKHIQLACSNRVCTDTSAINIALDNELISHFQIAPSLQLCPEDAAIFTDSSIGKIQSWYWIFGDGSSSMLQNPFPKVYSPGPRQGHIYPVSLIIKNNIGCFDTSTINLKILYNCYIAVPTGFTPNDDGLNDFLYPLNAYKADDLNFRVYNRYGQPVFETKDWTKKWDGKINGSPQPSGTYVWMLSYTNHDTGKQVALKGTTVLIR
jgi:gliding motility-associated-like protein